MSVQTIEAVSAKLLDLHRELIEVERHAYERVHGRLSPAELLDNLIHHPQFAWLRPLSTLIAEADVAAEADDPEERDAWLAAVRALLTPDPEGADFQRRYAERLQESPGVVVAHAAVLGVLGR